MSSFEFSSFQKIRTLDHVYSMSHANPHGIHKLYLTDLDIVKIPRHEKLLSTLQHVVRTSSLSVDHNTDFEIRPRGG